MLRVKFARLVLVVMVMAALLPLGGTARAQLPFRLTILHTNDTHAHHMPGADGNGGVTRQATLVKQIRKETPNVALVDAGDRFTGTLYHTVYQGQDNVQIMNALGYQVMTLGNHDFDNGSKVLAAFLDGLKFPVVSANVNASANKDLAGKWTPYTVLEIGGQKIGFIGLTTAETPEITINFEGKDAISFSDYYADVVNMQVDALHKEGVNKIILITHLGVGVDVELAAQISGVALIVGGHSHTLLESPIKKTDAKGAPIYIVQAGSYNTYLGRAIMEFDGDGTLTAFKSEPILIAKDLPEDPDMKALMESLSGKVDAIAKTTIKTATGSDAEAAITLRKGDCGASECALGSLIADAMRLNTKAQIAIMNTGGIRDDLPKGPVTVGQIINILPFGNTLATLKLKGEDVIAALENGVSRVGATSGGGRFPQVSGVRFAYSLTKAAGQRVSDVQVLGADGKYAPIDPAATYSVVTNNFMRTGGDGYTVFQDKGIDPYDFGPPLDEVVAQYIAANSPVKAETDGRISFK